MSPRKRSDLTCTDLFCGAGGSSLGAVEAGAELRMALNHWELAIETHNTNFPDADHDCADISATNPRRYPSTQILIASPECTNHSLANGKKRNVSQPDIFDASIDDPTAVRSRATMWDVPRFAEFHDYDIVIVENVVDARRWVMYEAWLHAMDALGYRHRAVYMNSMHAHPTPQSRDRMYVVFWKKGNRAPDLEFEPEGWCTQCEARVEAVQSWKPNRTWGRYGRQYVYLCPRCTTEVTPYYYAALNALDFSIEAPRIGDRKRPLRPRTLERIRYGLEKYGREPLLVVTNMTTDAGRVRSAIGDPAFTQTGSAITALVSPGFMMHYRKNADVGYPIEGLEAPLKTVTTNQQAYLAIRGSALITLRDHPRMIHNELSDPLPTQVASSTQTWVIGRAPFLSSYYGQDQAHRIDETMGTLSTRDRHALVEPGADVDVDDCYFRMLQPHEIQAGMAFPSDYEVVGNKRDRVKQLGNAVTPPVMRDLMKRCVRSLEAA